MGFQNHLVMVNILSWNVRGLNGLNKHEVVRLLCINKDVGLVGLLETKLKNNKMGSVIEGMFQGWSYLTNWSFTIMGE